MHPRRSSTTRSTAKASSITSTSGARRTAATSVRTISAPVASPPAWRMRRRLCAASRPSESEPVGVAVEVGAQREQRLHPLAGPRP